MLYQPSLFTQLPKKEDPKVDIETLISSGFTKTHIDYALKLSNDKTEMGLVNWMLDNPEEKIKDNIKAGRISDPFANPIPLPLEKKLDTSLKSNETNLKDYLGILIGKANELKQAVNNPIEEEKKEEIKLPDLSTSNLKLKIEDVAKSIRDKNRIRQFNSSAFYQYNYNSSLHHTQRMMLERFLSLIKVETRNADYNINLEGFNGIMEEIEDPQNSLFLDFLAKEKSTGFERLRNRLYESLNNVFEYYKHTNGQFGEIPEINLYKAFNSIKNTMVMSPRQVQRLLNQLAHYQTIKKPSPPTNKTGRLMSLFKEDDKIDGMIHDSKLGMISLKHTPAYEIATDKGFTEYEACVVCMDALRSYVYFPCRHLLTCSRCVGLFKTCPVCQSQIKEKVKILWGADTPAKR